MCPPRTIRFLALLALVSLLSACEADTNVPGDALMQRGDLAAARRVLELNAATHPASANAFDSLGEACLAAGDQACAIAAYQRVLVLKPGHRGARYELRRLTGRPLGPFHWLVWLHMVGGALAIVSGAAAMLAPKGARVHVLSGRIFAPAMLVMAGSAAIRAAMNMQAEALNFWMACLTLYLVVTGWRVARRREGPFATLDGLPPLFALATGAGLLRLAVQGGGLAGAAGVFGVIALVAAASDLRVLAAGYPQGERRIARHLWRMGLALFIAVGSLFLGQSQVFPLGLRQSGALGVPSALVAGALIYWTARYRWRRLRSSGRHAGADVARTSAQTR